MKIIIFGGSGRLGTALKSYFIENNLKVFTVGKNKNNNFSCDLTKSQNLDFIKKINPNIIFNCVALTDVDLCNDDIDKAYDINVKTAINLVRYLNKNKLRSKLIHISTDQVYNNKFKLNNNNEVNINLSNNYSITKYLSELVILNYKNSIVVRTNFFGHSKIKNRPSYTDYIKNNLEKNKSLRIPENIIFNPINLNILVEKLFLLAKTKLKGTFNIGSKNSLSKYSFAKKVAKKFKLNTRLIKPYKSNFIRDKRPLGTYMSVKKFEENTNLKLPSINYCISIL